MKIQLLLTACALTACGHLPLSAADANVIAADAERAIERAYFRVNEPALADATKPLDAALVIDPQNPALLYTRAFGHYAMTALCRARKNDEAMEIELKKAAALLERVKGAPWEAEAAALHGNILGQLIGLKGGLSGMTLGPKSNRLFATAEKVLPHNPRVLLFRGISLLNTPARWGGDSDEATKRLQRSVAAFTKAEASAAGPHWGHADALAWLGVAKKQAGDLKSARTTWEQALALAPDYGWVKFALLPSLGQEPAP